MKQSFLQLSISAQEVQDAFKTLNKIIKTRKSSKTSLRRGWKRTKSNAILKIALPKKERATLPMSKQVQEAFDNLTKDIVRRIEEREAQVIDAMKLAAKRNESYTSDK